MGSLVRLIVSLDLVCLLPSFEHMLPSPRRGTRSLPGSTLHFDCGSNVCRKWFCGSTVLASLSWVESAALATTCLLERRGLSEGR